MVYTFKGICDALHNDLPNMYALVAIHIVYMYLCNILWQMHSTCFLHRAVNKRTRVLKINLKMTFKKKNIRHKIKCFFLSIAFLVNITSFFVFILRFPSNSLKNQKYSNQDDWDQNSQHNNNYCFCRDIISRVFFFS